MLFKLETNELLLMVNFKYQNAVSVNGLLVIFENPKFVHSLITKNYLTSALQPAVKMHRANFIIYAFHFNKTASKHKEKQTHQNHKKPLKTYHNQIRDTHKKFNLFEINHTR